MRTVYVITMWTGGRSAKQWKSYEQPELLPNGTGVKFVNAETKMPVQVIGNISIEDFESGRAELELALRKEGEASSEESADAGESADNISDFKPREG
jgi:hypothetical protein